MKARRPRRRPAITALALLLLGLAAAAAAGSDDSDAGASGAAGAGLRVVTAFYPLEEAARGVGGSLVSVTGLTGPGQGPHDLELKARQRTEINRAAVILYLGRGFQPQVEKAVAAAPASVRKLDLLTEVTLLTVDEQLAGTQGQVDGETLEGDVDPHVWLDPLRMIEMVEAITRTFASVDPTHADTYRVNAAAYLSALSGLDQEHRQALGNCRSRVIVTSHRAFGYLADRYDLRQIPIAGISPEDEPDPKTLQAIAAEAKKEGVTTIYLESIAPPALARTVANEVDAQLDLLDPIEGLTAEQLKDGETYATIMRDNLQRLVRGLGCRP
jgi:zinc transport system substrate-binding protein